MPGIFIHHAQALDPSRDPPVPLLDATVGGARGDRSELFLVRTRTSIGAAGGLILCTLTACAHNQMLLEMSAAVVYDKPQIESVSHELEDSRSTGGAAVVKVTMAGDPGLEASFDIYPEIAENLPLKEIARGSYTGEFSFPSSVVGGPFTVIVRLRHEEAGEVVWRDPNLITIPLGD